MIGEVEIVCLGDSAHIPDLGLTLSRGKSIRILASNASRSRDLDFARAQGIVSVKSTRAAVLKTADTPGIVTNRIPDDNLKKVARSSLTWNSQPDSGSPSLEAAVRELTREVALLRDEIRQIATPSTPSVDVAAISEAIRSALSGITIPVVSGAAAPSAQGSLGSSDERFIPSGIVPTNLKADISPRTTNEGSGSLEDAQAALREARRRARKT
jgi:hypothetical protein